MVHCLPKSRPAKLSSRFGSPSGLGETSMIRGIKFVSIPVRDQDVALAFYSEALGFKIGRAHV